VTGLKGIVLNGENIVVLTISVSKFDLMIYLQNFNSAGINS